MPWSEVGRNAWYVVAQEVVEMRAVNAGHTPPHQLNQIFIARLPVSCRRESPPIHENLISAAFLYFCILFLATPPLISCFLFLPSQTTFQLLLLINPLCFEVGLSRVISLALASEVGGKQSVKKWQKLHIRGPLSALAVTLGSRIHLPPALFYITDTSPQQHSGWKVHWQFCCRCLFQQIFLLYKSPSIPWLGNFGFKLT